MDVSVHLRVEHTHLCRDHRQMDLQATVIVRRRLDVRETNPVTVALRTHGRQIKYHLRPV